MAGQLTAEDKSKIEKMKQLYEDFVKEMERLKAEGIDIVKQKLNEMDNGKINDILGKIRDL